jgi:hypothetical protein
MPTISELTSVYTANITDLEAKHARVMKLTEDFKRDSGGFEFFLWWRGVRFVAARLGRS